MKEENLKEKKNKRNIILFVIAGLAGFFLIGLFLSFIALIFAPGISTGNIALIKIRGPITVDSTDMFTGTTASSEEIIGLIEKAEQDPNIKAIMFDINSPGGTAVASKEIADAIKRVDKKTYSLIHEVGASGAYWIASSTDHIIANELSITGSIGVISSYIELEGLLERYNMTYRRLVSGERKDIGNPFKELSQEEKSILEKKLDKIHDSFIRAVAKNRNKSYEEILSLSTGEFYLGIEAFDSGLIDELGDMHTAKQKIKKDLNLTKIDFSLYSRPKSFIEILRGVFYQGSLLAGRGLGDSLKIKEEFRINT